MPSGVTATLTNLTITGGIGGEPLDSTVFSRAGGGIVNRGNLTLISCFIRGNTAGYGGGIVNSGTLLLISSARQPSTR